MPFTAVDGETRRFSLLSKAVVDNYVERYLQMMLMEGHQCIGDVSNPAVFSLAAAAGAQPQGHAMQGASAMGQRPQAPRLGMAYRQPGVNPGAQQASSSHYMMQQPQSGQHMMPPGPRPPFK